MASKRFNRNHSKREKKPEELSLILHSVGGDVEPTYQMVNIIRKKFKEFTVIIPRLAKSAATMMALGADKIYMTD